MTQQEVQEIYDRLLELTKAGAIQWKKSGEKEFTTSFSRSSVAIEGDWSRSAGAFSALKIYNDDGIVVAYAVPTTVIANLSPGAKKFELNPHELYSLVQDKVYKYSETSENLLDELRHLKAS